MPSVLINGFIIGILVAAPLGPVNLICIQRTLNRGTVSGLLAGLGAVLGDGLFAAAAAFGLVAISDLLGNFGFGVRLAGIGFLIALGVYTLRGATPRTDPAKIERGLSAQGPWAFGWTFGLTITNPITLLGFLMIFAGEGGLVTGEVSIGEAWGLILGVTIGSFAWWLLLCGLVGWLRGHIGPAILQRLNRISGGMILGFGLYLLWDLWLTGGAIDMDGVHVGI